MIIEPRIWGFLCTTAHPAGCAANVRAAIAATRRLGTRNDGPTRVLVVGASSGYGLAARITAAFGFGAATLGVFKEKPAKKRKTASAGWYHAAAFQRMADEAGLTSFSLNADAFADATRERAMELIRNQLGGSVDLVIHSLAAPMRTLPATGETLHTVLKPIGKAFHGTTIDTDTDRLEQVSVEPANRQEIDDTVRVMGGEDWQLWIEALAGAGLLADAARTLAFSYLGPELTSPIYRHGTIGRAKAHLEQTARNLSRRCGRDDFARVAVLKSIVTQASAAIPVIPLYLSVVRRVLCERGLEEGAIDQQNRLFRDFLHPEREPAPPVDEAGRVRLDERELSDEVQAACRAIWPRIDNDNLAKLTDYAGYKRTFLNLYGFARDDVDYSVDVDPVVDFEPIVL
ncbi:MAG: trans-2-enoyl-CoA reductase family protein [Nitrococcus sp.]|nr:trans-2-enoyl-CoA reductase family protein [Nitrococcus sp.]